MTPITGRTQVLAIIGQPISHSLSPLMQNAVLAELGIDAVFVPFAVAPTQLPAAVAGLRALGVIGFNVTVPHKEAILPLLDDVDDAARRIGAVNTVKLAGGRLVGSNTDAPGFLAAARADLQFDPLGAKVIIIGAGGAARAAVAALAGSGVRSILIVNRTQQRAKELSDEFKVYFPQVDMSSSDLAVLGDASHLGSFGLLVNTSSVGLNGTSFADLDLQGAAQLKVYDMVYGVEPTPLVQAARAAGCQAVNGHGMLAAQGELAFKTWLGVEPPAELMKNVLLRVCNQVTLDNH